MPSAGPSRGSFRGSKGFAPSCLNSIDQPRFLPSLNPIAVILQVFWFQGIYRAFGRRLDGRMRATAAQVRLYGQEPAT